MDKKHFSVGNIVTCTAPYVYSRTDVGIKCKVLRINTAVMEVIILEGPGKNEKYNVETKFFKRMSINFI